MTERAPSYRGFRSSSTRASAAARGASKKADTRPERLLRSELFKRGWRFRKTVRNLPGIPDIVFVRQKVAIFCDGDFWHGKDWSVRKLKLNQGSNAEYWTRKIECNMVRDAEQTHQLESEGWRVLRFWESEVLNERSVVISAIEVALRSERPRPT